MNQLSTLCVYCGANGGHQPVYAEVAAALGRELGRRGIGLVYGGGSVGLMGTVARATLQAGSPVTGVIPTSLTTRELMGHPIGELIIVPTMHERKARLAAMADAFIAMPGGFGTLDELFEAITWGQIGLHNKPIGLLNVVGYFDPLLAFIERSLAEGFIRPHHRDLFVVADEPAQLLDLLIDHQPPPGLIRANGLERA
jgi:uncharacterized protein (TIGR00730 family)